MEDRPIQYVYPLEMPLKQKVEAIAKKIYRADGVNFSAAASKTLAELTELGYGDLPVCIAKTQYSFSDNAKLTGAPTGFTMEVREVRLAAGAGFVVVICGNIYDHARPAQEARRRQYRRGCRGQDHGTVLNRIYRAMYSKEEQ